MVDENRFAKTDAFFDELEARGYTVLHKSEVDELNRKAAIADHAIVWANARVGEISRDERKGESGFSFRVIQTESLNEIRRLVAELNK